MRARAPFCEEGRKLAGFQNELCAVLVPGQQVAPKAVI